MVFRSANAPQPMTFPRLRPCLNIFAKRIEKSPRQKREQQGEHHGREVEEDFGGIERQQEMEHQAGERRRRLQPPNA